MASSAKSTSSELTARVAAELEAALYPGAHLLLGLSGGIDSVCLLHILNQLSPRLQCSLGAVHVHHGISPNADDWVAFCEALCRELAVPLAVERVDIGRFRGLGLEGAARAARYEAFAAHACDFLVLAQHRDDQAETLLLQLLRGAGVLGLSGMPRVRSGRETPHKGVLRPLLGASRTEIAAFALLRSLQWIEDESNRSSAPDRNFIRLQVLPLMEERYAHARSAIARSASHLREAAELLDSIGREDVLRAESGDGLDLQALRALGRIRGKNMLRTYCRMAGATVPGSALLEELWNQATTARDDANLCIDVDGCSFRRYRGRLYLVRRAEEVPVSGLKVPWRGECALPLRQLGGVLTLEPRIGHGVSAERLRAGPVSVQLRRGGERLQLDARRPQRTLKNLFQERGLPPWRRERLPLVYCGEALVAVPGIGEAHDWRAAPGEPGIVITWEIL